MNNHPEKRKMDTRKNIDANGEPESEHPAEGDVRLFFQWYWGNALKRMVIRCGM